MNSYLQQHFEVCIPTPFNSTAFSSNTNRISINVIRYVDNVSSSFDLISDPWIHFQPSLKTITDVNGKIPAQLMLPNTFVNCTGKLRYFDETKLYIDTPITFGFSGGPCFLQSNLNEWKLIGILPATTTIATYYSYYNLFTNKQEL
ncbi:unnamed protein product [Rotaria sp. Silwood1]|nr:unnamed protein product [Rotaria sp. Silwood1]CAF3818453.1 unnamed protein product [Rotaria sp. Silwood1]CAF4820293.1 unnamed protein product [Rotaria sp. Silwood1]CAF4829294.1 unnamed protein product [Rotaria sp. Silwood1]CAF4912228.1 unnamed protein product [Rotaria sp. Silwood1]